MTADVTRETTWRAYCRECGWSGDRHLDEDFAEYDADEHDERSHS